MCLGGGASTPPPPAPVTSDNQQRLAAQADAQSKANEQIAARKRRVTSLTGTGNEVGAPLDTSGTGGGTALAAGKTTLGQ